MFKVQNRFNKNLNANWELRGVSNWMENPLRCKNGGKIMVRNHGGINCGMIRTTPGYSEWASEQMYQYLPLGAAYLIYVSALWNGVEKSSWDAIFWVVMTQIHIIDLAFCHTMTWYHLRHTLHTAYLGIEDNYYLSNSLWDLEEDFKIGDIVRIFLAFLWL